MVHTNKFNQEGAAMIEREPGNSEFNFSDQHFSFILLAYSIIVRQFSLHIVSSTTATAAVASTITITTTTTRKGCELSYYHLGC
jgi:hypothetical protein